MGKNPPGQICLADFLGRVTAPGIVLCEFPLLEMIAELRDRKLIMAFPELSSAKTMVIAVRAAAPSG